MCVNKMQKFLADKENVKIVLYLIRKVWYVILLILFSIYVGCNFNQLVTQCFACQFNGNSLIFILWIVLLFLPLFSSIEGYGFKFIKDREEQEKQTLQIQLLRDNVVKREEGISKEDLEKKFKTLNEKDKNE